MPSRQLLLLLAMLVLLLTACAQPSLPPIAPAVGHKSCDVLPDWYRVKRGDTLFHIGWTYCINYLDIARWNKLRNPDRIAIGQRLRLRPSTATLAAKPSRPSTAVSDRSRIKRPAPKVTSTAVSPPKPAVTANKPVAGKRPGKTATPTRNSNNKATKRTTRGWRWPTRGKIVSDFAAGVPGRNGIRISARRGETIRAASPGLIVYTGDSLPGYGTLIIVEHGGGLLSAYGHVGRMLVKKGDRVGAGDAIAELNSSGDKDTTLHFEIRKNGQPVNPLGYLPS